MKQINNVLLIFAFAILEDKVAEMRHEYAIKVAFLITYFRS